MIFHLNCLPADNSHEIHVACLIFLFLKKATKFELSSAANYRWRFKGYNIIFCKLTVQSLVRRRFLLSLIRVCTICLCTT